MALRRHAVLTAHALYPKKAAARLARIALSGRDVPPKELQERTDSFPERKTRPASEIGSLR